MPISQWMWTHMMCIQFSIMLNQDWLCWFISLPNIFRLPVQCHSPLCSFSRLFYQSKQCHIHECISSASSQVQPVRSQKEAHNFRITILGCCIIPYDFPIPCLPLCYIGPLLNSLWITWVCYFLRFELVYSYWSGHCDSMIKLNIH